MAHLEHFLGEIHDGWSVDPDGQPMGFQLVRFDNSPEPGLTTFTTLGLSDTPLRSPRSGKLIRHELVLTVPRRLGNANVPGVLQDVANEALASGTAYLRGDVLGPRGPLFAGTEMTALYFTMPVYYSDGFDLAHDGDRQIVMVWVVPISNGEASFVKTHGWSRFEAVADSSAIDLFDVYRTSTDLPR